jgi:hypothetical protein
MNVTLACRLEAMVAAARHSVPFLAVYTRLNHLNLVILSFFRTAAILLN